MPDDVDRFMTTLGEGLHAEALAESATGVYSIHVPTDDLPPGLVEKEREFFKEWWDRLHPKPPPPPPSPDVLSYPVQQLTWPDSTPVGGWVQLSMHKDGNWNYSGHLHDSGFLSENDVVVWGIKNLDTNEIFLFRHTGQMSGTAGLTFGGSRDDDWDESGNNGPLADSWDGFFKVGGGRQSVVQAKVTSDLDSVVKDVTTILGIAAAIIAVV
jgi:hypothetical protein